MGEMYRSQRRLNRLTLGWVIWSIAMASYLVVLFVSVYGVNLVCTVGDDSSPAGSPFLSLWPLGPGCRSYEDLPPSLAWTVVLFGLIGSGVSLAINSSACRLAPVQPDGDPRDATEPAEPS